MAEQDVSLRVKRVTLEVIDTLRRQIAEAVQPRQIVLFGSLEDDYYVGFKVGFFV